MENRRISIVVAVADNYAIGKDNALLWHISEDLKYFKSVTSGHTVIMGRRTFESIGRALPKRRNIVVTRDPGLCGLDRVEGIECAPSLEAAISMCDEDEAFVIGGGQIYATSLPFADRLYLTRVHTVIGDADTFFPAVGPEWNLVSSSGMKTDPESGLEFEFQVLERK